MQPPLPTLPEPSSTWAHLPPAVWGLGSPNQAGEMSDTDISRVTPADQSDVTKLGLGPRYGPRTGDGTPWVRDVRGPSEQPAPSGS